MSGGIRDPGCGTRCGVAAPAGRFRQSRIPLPQSRQKGFSLLEVIAAMLLLAIAFAALMKVAGGAIVLSRNAAAHDEAALWARSLLDSVFVTEPVAPGSRSGRFNDRYRWTLDVTPWQAPGTSPGGALQLYRLDLAVRWGSTAHPQVAHFDTLRLAKPQAPTGGAP
jgi:general secretion pathway protein I